MQTAPKPQPCSKCGRTDAKAVSKAFDYPVGKGAWNSEPVATTYVFKCACGTAWTQTVKNDPPPKSDPA